MMRKYLIMVLLMVVPGWAAALGLGNIELHSALNQPLDARIKLLSPTRAEIQSLKVGLADNDAFERAGIDRPFILSHLRFEIVTNNHGPDYVHITTKDPVREPFLNFLVEADWSNGRLYREYTVLLDPPLYNPDARQIVPSQQPAAPAMREMQQQQQQPAPAPAPAESKKVSPAAPMGGGEAAPAKPAQPKPAMPAKPAGAAPAPPPAPAQAPAPTAAGYNGGDYGPTVTGNTLWSIAREMRPDNSISIQQMMLALLRANPEAFINNNIDGLRRGYVLHMPSREEITSLNKQAALSQVKSQYAMWDEFKGKMAAEAGQRPAGGTATPGETAPAATAKTESELKIVTPEKGKGAGQAAGGGQKTAKDLALANEQLQSLTAENTDLKQQVSQSDAIIGDLKRLINLKGNEAAALQQQLANMQAKQAAAAAAAAAAAKKKAAEAAAAKTKPAPKAKSAPKAKPQPPAPGMVDRVKSMVLDNLTAIGGVIAALILAIAGLVLIRRRAAGADAEVLPEEPALTDETELPSESEDVTDVNPAAELDEEGEEGEEEEGEEVAIGEETADEKTVFPPVPEDDEVEEVGAATATEFPASEEPVVAEEEVSPGEEEDPLSEVNVFLAYEHFDQAEEFVRDAIKDDPDNLDFHSKLLEVFYAAGNKAKYEKEAEVLHDLVNGEGPHWEMAQVMWQELSPNRPLFAEPTGGEEEEAAGETTGVGMVDLTAAEEEETGLDFDLGTEGETAAKEEEEDEFLDFTTAGGADEGSTLDFTTPVAEDEDILDVTAAVGLDMDTEEEETPVEEDDKDLLDITGGNDNDNGNDNRTGDTVKIPAGGGGEDLLDVTTHADLETDSIDEDLLDVTAATSAGADSNELLDVGTGEESNESEAPAAAEGGGDDDKTLDFDIGDLDTGAEEGQENDEEKNPLDTLDLGVDGLEFETDTPGAEEGGESEGEASGESEAGNMVDFEGSEENNEDEGGLTLDLEAGQDAGETESAPDSGPDLDSTFTLERQADDDDGDISLDMPEEAGAGEDQGALLDLTTGGASQADENTGEESGGDSGGLSLDLEVEEGQPGDDAVPTLSLESSEEDSGDEKGEQPTVFVPRSGDSEEQSVEDEVATKLDLAKAYVELGDKDSAKNILEEIINDGSEEQRRQAEELLSQVS